MKKFVALVLVALFAIIGSNVMAQDTTTDVIVLPDVVVACPGNGITNAIKIAARLVLEFNDTEDRLVVPFATLRETDTGRIVEITRVELNCDSSGTDVAVIDRSEGAGVGEVPPRPDNPPALEDTLPGHLIVVTGPANMRSCAEPTCSRVAIVDGGDRLVALGHNEDFSWWFVQAADIRGWIWNDLVAIRGDLSDVPLVVTDGEPVPPSVYIGFTGNPIYDSLSASGKAICSVQGGAEYPLIGRSGSSTEWVWIDAVCTDGSPVSGWMSADAVAIRNTGQVFVPIVGPDGP